MMRRTRMTWRRRRNDDDGLELFHRLVEFADAQYRRELGRLGHGPIGKESGGRMRVVRRVWDHVGC